MTHDPEGTGSALILLPPDGRVARRDGKELFFLDLSDNLVAVDVNTVGNTVRLGTPHVLFHGGQTLQQGAYDMTADGKKFIVTNGDVNEESQPLTLVQNWTADLRE